MFLYTYKRFAKARNQFISICQEISLFICKDWRSGWWFVLLNLLLTTCKLSCLIFYVGVLALSHLFNCLFCFLSLACMRWPFLVRYILHFYIFMHFNRRFYPKRLTVHSGYTCYLYVCSLGIEPTTFALLTQCSNHWATGTVDITGRYSSNRLFFSHSTWILQQH